VSDLSGFSMMELFRTEVESQAAVLSEGLLGLEVSSVSAEAIEPMMRAAHSIKGAARIVGLEAAVRIAHVLEDCFVAAQRGQIRIEPRHVDVLLRGVDALTRISRVPEAESPTWLTEHSAELERLLVDLAQIQAGGVPEVSAPASATASAAPRAPAGASLEPTRPMHAGSTEQAPIAVEPPKPLPEQVERVVRVTADSLTYLMGLAGESLVEARRLRPFVDSLLALKRSQRALCESLQALENRCSSALGLTQAQDVEVVARANQQAKQGQQLLNDKIEEFEDYARRMEDLSDRLHHEVISSRVRPLADGVRGFPRLVRDVARQLGKKVKLEIRGEKTGVDRDILEKLDSPLNHLIRNALDHGIELPEEREAAGKPAGGTIILEGRHRAGRLHVTLTDDGRGVDLQRLRAKIVRRGLVSSEMKDQLSEAELLEFLFLPGLSTREEVTDLSGRGVGLDVVQSMVQAVGGSVSVTSQAGRGTRFTLQLPITRSVIRALLVRISNEPYAFPLTRIDRIQVVPRDAVRVLEGRPHFLLDDQSIGLVAATQVLELPTEEEAADHLSVVVVSDRSHRFGVVVGGFLGERDLQVRTLDARLGTVPDISSASVLEDGWPVLIVDVESLVRSIDNLLSGRRLRHLDGAQQHAQRRLAKRILVVEDSITVRELERQLLEGHGYSVDTAVDGVDGWNAVRSGHYELVVSDVDMPRMDGIEFVRRIKQDPALRSLPVVIVSYKDREEDRMRGLDAGANCYLTKSSFHDQTFLDTIIDLIGEAGE
jgi:two-component system, chemotaxis family, sensor histidine kinase and response regulator WspE